MAVLAASFDDDNPIDEIDQSHIKMWLSKIISAKHKWKDDFTRMRDNMKFVSGLQWPGQAKMDDDRYIANLTLQLVNQKVATLYAKNPTFVAKPVEKMNYQVWDGQTESLLSAIAQAEQFVLSGQPLPLEMQAFFIDVENGRLREQLIGKVCETLEKLFKYAIRSQKPEFKGQLKKAVRRVITCGVAYGRPIFCRDGPGYTKISTIDPSSDDQDRINRSQVILDRLSKQEIAEDSPEAGTLRSLAMSLGTPLTISKLPERLEFDFPPATSIIVDEMCRGLTDFVNCNWIAQEYILPVEEVNAIFGVDIKIGGQSQVSEYKPDGTNVEATYVDGAKSDIFANKPICLYEVFDKKTLTRFFIAEGHHAYLLPPEHPWPEVNGFWHHFALTFNDIDTDDECKVSIFPPSDVQTVKSAQMEWNRTRDALRDQRVANAPTYIVRKGTLTEADKIALQNRTPNSVIELEGIPAEKDPSTFVSILQVAAIDPQVYATQPLEQDILLSGGMQQANIGPAQPNVTATVGTIAEQSRLNVSASNIDDLDGFLSRLAQAGGEMCLQGYSEETVKRVAGLGAVWPTMPQTRQDFLNEINLEIEAASSGRPNKAIEVANWRAMAPLLFQAGANPVGIIEETAKRLDESFDVSKLFPITPPSQPSSEGEDGSQGKEENPTSESPQGGSKAPPNPSPPLASESGSDGFQSTEP